MKRLYPYRLRQLQTTYRLLKMTEVLLLSVAAGMLTWACVAWIPLDESIRWAVTALTAGVAGVTMAYVKKVFVQEPERLVRILNRHYPQLEESVDLLVSEDATLTLLQRIQRQRIENKLEELYPQLKVPSTIKLTSAVAAVLILIAFVLMAFTPHINPTSPSINEAVKELNTVAQETRLESILITITPPPYMGRPLYRADNLHLVVPEGSSVSWKVTFDKPATAALIFSGRDSVAWEADRMKTYTRKIQEAGFYQVGWYDQGKWILSDYYKIEIIKDQPPKLAITNLEQFTKLEFVQPLTVQVQASLQDDFGLTNAAVIATMSKGSGESVKFREEKLNFDSPTSIYGKQVQAAVTLDLIALGLEPGDELYFYVEANDNKVPTSNYSRTETFFIAIPDTTQYQTVEEEGLGVDLMPEYFRSQRQIIIDTEKLLKERKKIPVAQFKFTSNELGYDQKVLRLRYGQFMGEEFEDQIGGVVESPAELDHDETAEETVSRLSHQHDTENEHNLVEHKEPTADHPDHKEDEKNPLAAFAHQHDDGEQATFFVQSVRAKLKAALTVMWDAELYLRLNEPEKSLPYQYTALKLLKEISNDSRIYVHRTGFDPPPLKEEKRLSGDLADVRSFTGISKQPDTQQYPAIHQAQQMLEHILLQNSLFTPEDKVVLTRAGNELAALALERPGNYLEALSIIKNLVEDRVPETDRRSRMLVIRKVFMQVAPRRNASPAGKTQPVHPLNEEFLKSLHD